MCVCVYIYGVVRNVWVVEGLPFTHLLFLLVFFFSLLFVSFFFSLFSFFFHSSVQVFNLLAEIQAMPLATDTFPMLIPNEFVDAEQLVAALPAQDPAGAQFSQVFFC